ncbi:hypothetical protein HN51_053430, partial [Arachis hypogaea]
MNVLRQKTCLLLIPTASTLISGGNVPVVDHTSPSASPDIFGFSDLDPSYSQSPFELVHVAENGNDNGYHDDSVFVSDEPVLPAPTEMGSEEGYTL